jgi:hypothetical protein
MPLLRFSESLRNKGAPRVGVTRRCLNHAVRGVLGDPALVNVYTIVYIYPRGELWPLLACLSPGTAKR